MFENLEQFTWQVEFSACTSKDVLCKSSQTLCCYGLFEQAGRYQVRSPLPRSNRSLRFFNQKCIKASHLRSVHKHLVGHLRRTFSRFHQWPLRTDIAKSIFQVSIRFAIDQEVSPGLFQGRSQPRVYFGHFPSVVEGRAVVCLSSTRLSRLPGLSFWCKLAGFPDPWRRVLVRNFLSG